MTNGNTAAARRHYERALDIDARNGRSLLALARIDHTQGNNERAWERLQRYFTVAGTDADTDFGPGNRCGGMPNDRQHCWPF